MSLSETPLFDSSIDQQLGILMLTRGIVGEHSFWALLSMYPSSFAEYEAKVQNMEEVNLQQYGKVLHADYGVHPSKEKMDFFTQRYGADYRLMFQESSHDEL